MRKITTLSISALALAALAIAACGTLHGSAEAGGTVETPAGSITFEGKVSANEPGKFNATNNTNKCFKLSFYDKSGNELGSVTINPGGGGGSVPEGSTSFGATEVPCTPNTHGEGHNILDGTYVMFGGPLYFADGSRTGNALYSFVVRAHDSEEAQAITRTTLEAPLGTPFDARVQPMLYQRIEASAQGTHVYALGRSAFIGWQMDFNGIPNYAVLGAGAQQFQLAPGLWMVDTWVNRSDIFGWDRWNTAHFRYSNQSGPALSADYRLVQHPQ